MRKVILYIVVFSLFNCKKSERTIMKKQLYCDSNKYFTHGCGTGCAMNYEMLNYKKTDSSFILQFRVVMDIYEETEDTFKIKYELFCNNKESVKFLSVDDNQNMYDAEVNSANISFKKFGDDFCLCQKP
jgi:hypothetical protein